MTHEKAVELLGELATDTLHLCWPDGLDPYDAIPDFALDGNTRLSETEGHRAAQRAWADWLEEWAAALRRSGGL